eukprot:SM000357S13388  [mRNA]  locus=s357:31585:32067:+ [translate_table: standard]
MQTETRHCCKVASFAPLALGLRSCCASSLQVRRRKPLDPVELDWEQPMRGLQCNWCQLLLVRHRVQWEHPRQLNLSTINWWDICCKRTCQQAGCARAFERL